MDHNYKRPAIFFLALALAISACTQATSQPTPTPTRDLGPERTATAQAQEKADAQASQTANALATHNFLASQTANALATLDAQSTADAQASATKAQKELNAQATYTQIAYDQLTETAEHFIAQTAEAQPLYEAAKLLFQNGAISTAEGEYIAAADWEKEWAQLNYYQYWPIMEALALDTSNFILRADLKWSSASDNANWNTAGCGFVVLDIESGKHHLIDLTMDGYASLWYNDGKGTAYPKAKKITTAQGIPEGQAEFVLAVQGQKITVYVNNEEAFSYTDTRYIPGLLAYTLSSGTNKDYGTRCEITNVGLWQLEATE